MLLILGCVPAECPADTTRAEDPDDGAWDGTATRLGFL